MSIGKGEEFMVQIRITRNGRPLERVHVCVYRGMTGMFGKEGYTDQFGVVMLDADPSWEAKVIVNGSQVYYDRLGSLLRFEV
jgi:hypothetical protein